MNMSLKALLTVAFSFHLILSSSEGNEDQNKLPKAVNKFAFKLYKRISKDHNEKLIFSPYSLASALSMLLVGARSETLSEISETLGYNDVGLSTNEVIEAFRHSLETHQLDSENFTLHVANSLWLQKGFPFQPEFQSLVQEHFLAKATDIDFKDRSKAIEKINSWVKKQTKDKIPKLLDEISPDAVLALINAVFFNGSWDTQFEKNETINSTFHNAFNREPSRISMMTSESMPCRFTESSALDSKVLEVPYKGDDYSMVIILPNKMHGATTTLKRTLTEDTLNDAIQNLKLKDIAFHLPKFNVSTDLKLVPALKGIGISKAFQKNVSDLSGISRMPLFVSNVIHKAICEVQEEGTVAAAASAVIPAVVFSAPPATFIVDHPFLFLIRHIKSGMILFLGHVLQM